jgi:hypothetical protein
MFWPNKFVPGYLGDPRYDFITDRSPNGRSQMAPADAYSERLAGKRIAKSLNSGSPGLVLRQRSAELQRLFPADPLVSELTSRLAAARD